MKKLIIVVMFLITNFLYCTLDWPDDPKPPTWDIAVRKIPILNSDTLRLGDKLKTKDFKRIDGSDSTLAVEISDDKNFDIGSKLKIPALNNKHFADNLGNFKISSSPTITKNILFNELYNNIPTGSSAIIPPAPLGPIEKRDITFQEFSSVSIASGQFRINIYNHLGFVLGNDVKLDLIDVTYNRTIATKNFAPIQNNTTGTEYLDLSGQTISNNLKVKIYGQLVGSEGRLVTINNNSGFDVSITPENIVASEATAKIPQQKLTCNPGGNIDLNSDSLKLKTATIETGSILFGINNSTTLPMNIKLIIPNLKYANNSAITINLTLNPNSTQNQTVLLDNCILDLATNSQLDIQAEITINPNQNQLYSDSRIISVF